MLPALIPWAMAWDWLARGPIEGTGGLEDCDGLEEEAETYINEIIGSTLVEVLKVSLLSIFS